MGLNIEISEEEFKVFLQETEEQIELLDNNIILLEKGNQDILQDVFRAAHTIKGSSAMVGLKPMTELTHVMENLLDNLRSGQLKVSPLLIDALLAGLDTLKMMKDEIASGQDISCDSQPAVVQLQAVMECVSGLKATINSTETPAMPPDVSNLIENAQMAGQRIFHVKMEFNPESEWVCVRALQAFNHLTPLGKVVYSTPTQAEIEADQCETSLRLIFITDTDADAIRGELVSIAEVKSVDVTDFEAPAAAQSPAAAAAAITGSGDASKPEAQERSESQSFQSVRIDVQVLDNLMNIVEELVIDRSRIGQVCKQLSDRYTSDDLIQDLSQTSDHVIKVINELQNNIMKVRMIPIGTIFNRFPRLVRDLAQLQHKEVDFKISGGETELDRSIIEQIRDPLIHLIRNAVDHGIESPELRKAAGKPTMATVNLSATQEQEHIVITLKDDGKGIDAAKVRDSAVAKGQITVEAAQAMTEYDALHLIFSNGVSTAEKVSEVSGRGVGMDIVRTNIENLGGSIKVETRVGEGTTFIINLPLTVAIIQSIMVKSAGTTFAVPLNSVLETIKLKASDVKTIVGREVIHLRDSIIPILRLNSILGVVVNKDEKTAGHVLVIVVKVGKSKIGLIIDAVIEPQEIVVKPLSGYLEDVQGIAGATICGNGEVALILDVNSLAERLETGRAATAVK
jgi:two-component system chemotaxis sensor kinase CheA